MRIVLIIALSLVASGCAQQAARQQAEAQRAAMEIARNSLEKSCSEAYNDPAVAILRPKVPQASSTATFAQLGDKSKANGPEKIAIEQYEKLSQPCRAQALAFFSRFTVPGVVDAYHKLEQDDRLLRSALWNGDLTYGEFNTKRIQIANQFNSARELAIARANHEAAAAAQQQRANELQQWQIIQQMQQTQQIQQANQIQQQQLYQMRTPAQTNCYRYGNQVNCTTY